MRTEDWISVKDRPLIEQTPNGWVATADGDKEFMAALRYWDDSKKQHGWWIRHCVLEDGVGLCVVGDDDNEPAGWEITDVTHWQSLPEPPKE